MNKLNDLIKEVERLNKSIKNCNSSASMPLMWIKETVEAVDWYIRSNIMIKKDWQKLKKLLKVEENPQE